MNRINLNAFEITQLEGKPVYIAKIKYSELSRIVAISYRAKSGDTKYQRPLKEGRISGIVSFLKKRWKEESKTRLITFPTPIIIAANTDILQLKSNQQALEDNDIVTIKPVGDIHEISIPAENNEKPVLIVDGQHRFVAVKRFIEQSSIEGIKDFEFSILLLLNYDLYEQARIFADVNFNQKPVNKSLYYDIFGSLPDSPSDIKMAHYIAKNLNERDNSPLNGMIKMLGVGEGVISLAFFSETIVNILSREKPKGFSIAYNLYIKGKKEHVKLLYVLINYFDFIKDNFQEYWPQKNNTGKYSAYTYKSILLKTTGMFALLNLFDYLFDDDKYLSTWTNKETLNHSLNIKLKRFINNKDKLFGSDVKSFQGGGKTIQKALLDQILKYID